MIDNVSVLCKWGMTFTGCIVSSRLKSFFSEIAAIVFDFFRKQEIFRAILFIYGVLEGIIKP